MTKDEFRKYQQSFCTKGVRCTCTCCWQLPDCTATRIYLRRRARRALRVETANEVEIGLDELGYQRPDNYGWDDDDPIVWADFFNGDWCEDYPLWPEPLRVSLGDLLRIQLQPRRAA